GHGPHAHLPPARLPAGLFARGRGVDRGAGDVARAGEAALPLVLRHDAVPLEAPRHDLQSPLPRARLVQPARHLVLSNPPRRARRVGKTGPHRDGRHRVMKTVRAKSVLLLLASFLALPGCDRAPQPQPPTSAQIEEQAKHSRLAVPEHGIYTGAYADFGDRE